MKLKLVQKKEETVIIILNDEVKYPLAKSKGKKINPEINNTHINNNKTCKKLF